LKQKNEVGAYFPDSFDLTWSWIKGLEAVHTFPDTFKAEISAEYAHIILGGKKVVDYESVDSKMGDFVPQIRR
jgi:hypothetical protein